MLPGLADPVPDDTRSGGRPLDGAPDPLVACVRDDRLHHCSYDAVNDLRCADFSSRPDRRRDATARHAVRLAGSGPIGPTSSPPWVNRRSACRTAAGTRCQPRQSGLWAERGQPCEFPSGHRVGNRPFTTGTWRWSARRLGGDVPSSAPCAASSPSRPGRRRSTSCTAARRRAAGSTARGSGCAWSPASTGARWSTGAPVACPARPTLQVLLRLRAAADVDPRRRRHRPSGGLRPTPQAGPAHRRGHAARATCDTSVELFTSGAGFLVLPEDGPPAPRRPTGGRSTSCAPAPAGRPAPRPRPPDRARRRRCASSRPRAARTSTVACSTPTASTSSN